MDELDTREDARYDYDVAVSFAGEDRQYVEEVIRGLKGRGFTVFYDQDQLADLWGSNLIDFLEAVYTRRARYAALFISRNYAEKKWPAYERQSAQTRALQETSPYILPIRLDDTELPGLHSTIGYVDARHVSVPEIIELFAHKLGAEPNPAPPVFNGRVPRDSDEMAAVLAERPGAWEYLLYAGALHQRLGELENKYRDHVLEFSPRNGTILDDRAAFYRIKDNFSVLSEITDSFNRVLSPPAQEAAFGVSGEPGDPERILHIADRFIKVYEEYLDWAAFLRGVTISDDDLREAADALARLVDQPIGAMRDFIAEYVAHADTWTERLATGEHIEHSVTLELEIDHDQMERCTSALRRYAARVAE